MKALKVLSLTLLLSVIGSTAQRLRIDPNKPVTFEDVLRELLGVIPLERPTDRIMNAETAAKLRESLQADDDVMAEPVAASSSQTQKVLSPEMMASKPSRFDDVEKLKSVASEMRPVTEEDLEKGDDDDDDLKSSETSNSKPEMIKADVTKDGSSSSPEKKWKKPSRFDGSYDELMQEWKLRQAAILKTVAAANKKQTKPEVATDVLSERMSGLKDEQIRPNRPNHHRQKRFFFSWPGSFESPWPETDRANTFIGNDPFFTQAQQIFRLFSNSFFNGFREFMRGFLRLDRPATAASSATEPKDEKKDETKDESSSTSDTEDSATSSLLSSLADNELKKRTLAGRMASWLRLQAASPRSTKRLNTSSPRSTERLKTSSPRSTKNKSNPTTKRSSTSRS